MKNKFTFWFLPLIIWLIGCGSKEIKPVDIYPEDMCALCKMAFSDPVFSAEIVTENNVLKFDDIGCMEEYKTRHPELKPLATFVKDYDTKKWIALEKSTVVETNIATPMASGKIAFSDLQRATDFAREHKK